MARGSKRRAAGKLRTVLPEQHFVLSSTWEPGALLVGVGWPPSLCSCRGVIIYWTLEEVERFHDIGFCMSKSMNRTNDNENIQSYSSDTHEETSAILAHCLLTRRDIYQEV